MSTPKRPVSELMDYYNGISDIVERKTGISDLMNQERQNNLQDISNQLSQALGLGGGYASLLGNAGFNKDNPYNYVDAQKLAFLGSKNAEPVGRSAIGIVIDDPIFPGKVFPPSSLGKWEHQYNNFPPSLYEDEVVESRDYSTNTFRTNYGRAFTKDVIQDNEGVERIKLSNREWLEWRVNSVRVKL